MTQNFSNDEIYYLRRVLDKFSENYIYAVSISRQGNIQLVQYKRWCGECTGRLFTITRECGKSGAYVLRNRVKGMFYEDIPYIMFRNSHHDCYRPDVSRETKQTIEWQNSRGRFHSMIDLCERMKQYWQSGKGKIF